MRKIPATSRQRHWRWVLLFLCMPCAVYADNLFSEARLKECLQRVNGAAPTEVIRNALEAVKRFATGAEQNDDITTLAIRYLRH